MIHLGQGNNVCGMRNSKLLLRLFPESPHLPAQTSRWIYFRGRVLFLFISFQVYSFSVFRLLPSVRNAEGTRDAKSTELSRTQSSSCENLSFLQRIHGVEMCPTLDAIPQFQFSSVSSLFLFSFVFSIPIPLNHRSSPTAVCLPSLFYYPGRRNEQINKQLLSYRLGLGTN